MPRGSRANGLEPTDATTQDATSTTRASRSQTARSQTTAEDDDYYDEDPDAPEEEEEEEPDILPDFSRRRRPGRGRGTQKRYRGGPPPATPIFKPDGRDGKALRKWLRKVDMWRRHIIEFMPLREAALRLIDGLQGEAEDEAELLDVEKIDNEDSGIDYIIEEMKRAFSERDHHRKTKLLTDHERVRRNQGAAIRTYINRYRRVEASLREIGIDVARTYDPEARGHRLLETCFIGPEARRNVITMCQGKFDFDRVSAALLELYPENRAAPPSVSASG